VVIPQADEASLPSPHSNYVKRDSALNQEMLFFAKYAGIPWLWRVV